MAESECRRIPLSSVLGNRAWDGLESSSTRYVVSSRRAVDSSHSCYAIPFCFLLTRLMTASKRDPGTADRLQRCPHFPPIRGGLLHAIAILLFWIAPAV